MTDTQAKTQYYYPLQDGDDLDGKPILRVTHIDTKPGYAPAAIVTRAWGKRFGNTEYATHFLNKRTGGCSHGDYTTDRDQAGAEHAEKVKLWSA